MAAFKSVFVFILLGAFAHGIEVNTTEGVVEGYKANDGDYLAFYGVPYAGPTDGDNRFKGPVPPSAYPGVFHAISSNIICAQPSSRGLIGVENCLSLSIFTKNVTTPKPVIVWLNAEDYTTTDTQMRSYKNFVEKDVVFISLNFRVSIFGFLCLGVKEAPGNAGLRDVIQGLKWIKSNIANFGGDPNNVVMMGHASGGAMVDLITMSPLAKDLVHKAITISGSSLSPWAVAYDPIGYAHLLGSKLGYGGKTNKDLAQHLVKTDTTVLLNTLLEFNFKNNTPLFAPCIENPKLTNDTVLADAPINLLRSGNYLQIPYIAIYMTEEGTMRATEALSGWLEAMQANFTDFLQVDLDVSNNRTAVATAIREFYFSKSSISMATIDDYLNYFGDTLVAVSVIRNAKERGTSSTNNVRLLEFGYMGTQNSDWTFRHIPINGVRHGGILNYLFNYDLLPNDLLAMRAIMTRLTNFALTGSPAAPTYPDWFAVTKDLTHYLSLNGKDTEPIPNTTTVFGQNTRTDPHKLTMAFWNDMINKYYVAPKPINSSSMYLSSIFFVSFSLILLRLF